LLCWTFLNRLIYVLLKQQFEAASFIEYFVRYFRVTVCLTLKVIYKKLRYQRLSQSELELIWVVLKWSFCRFTWQCSYRHNWVLNYFIIILGICLLTKLKSRIASNQLGCKFNFPLVQLDFYFFWNIRRIYRHHTAWYLVICDINSVLLIHIFRWRITSFTRWLNLRAIPSEYSFGTVFRVLILCCAVTANCVKSCHNRMKIFLKDIKIFLNTTGHGTFPLNYRIFALKISD